MAELTVMASGAIKAAYITLIPRFQAATGHNVHTIWAPSVDMMRRLKDGELVDLVILSAASLDELIAAGFIGGRTDLARAGVAVAVKAGAPRPDISSGEAVKRAVLAAKSVCYSTGPSGIYLVKLFERMGIAEAIRDKVKIAKGEFAGSVVARGDAEIGFQQMSELKPINGIDIIGHLPADIQEITTFSAGVHTRAAHAAQARELVNFLRNPESRAVITASGMEPA